MRGVWNTSLRMLLIFTVLTGLAYPLLVTAVARLAFRDLSEGSLVRDLGGTIVGSRLLAQKFQSDRYFWPRPSAADYATIPSGASNLSLDSAALKKAVEERAMALRKADGLGESVEVPADLVYASGSGLDPHISPHAALFQCTRVARARGLGPDGPAQLKALVDKFTITPAPWLFSSPMVNVLALNRALDGAIFKGHGKSR